MSKARRHRSPANRNLKVRPRHDLERSTIPPIIALAGLMIAVALAVLVAHWPALSARALLFDDAQYLTKNTLVQQPGWASAYRFLTEVTTPSTVRGYYQPLSMISLMLDYATAGQPNNLLPFHRTSLILHVFNTMLIVVLLFKLFGEPWLAAMVGLLFGVHPMTVETIPWVGERKTLLATFFALWSLILYVRYARTNGWTPYALCLVMYVLALMSKPTSTPLPVLFLLMDYWPIRRLSWRSVAEKIPFFIIAGVFAIITIVSQGKTATVEMPTETSPSSVLLTLCHNIIFYPYKIILPIHLSSHYPIPDPIALSDAMVLAGVIGTCVLIPALLLSLRWTRALLIGWGFFFVAILPSTGVVGFTNVIASDKFAYLPSVGLLMVLVWLLKRFWNPPSDTTKTTRRRCVVLAVVVALAASETIATRRYLVYWQDSETLFRHMLDVAPQAAPPHYSLATVLAKLNKTDEAIHHYEQALKRRPHYLDAHYNLANALIKKNRLDEAIQHYQAVLQIDPDFVLAHSNLGNALLQKGNIKQAIKHMSRTLDLQPDNFRAHYNLANAFISQGKVDEAIRHYTRAVKLKPDFSAAHRNLASALARVGRRDEAINTYRAVLRIQPFDEQTHYELGILLAQQGQIDAAVREFKTVLQIAPNYAAARAALEAATAQKSK